MAPEFLTGIEEIDAQHKEIEEVAQAVIDAVTARDKWHIVHYILVRLYELLRFHFAVEESMMRIVAFPEIDEHKRIHADILRTVERMKVSTLDPKACEGDDVMNRQFSFLTHIVDHDKRLAEYAVANSDKLKY